MAIISTDLLGKQGVFEVMGRVFQLFGLLFGVILLGLTSGLATSRPTVSPQLIPIIESYSMDSFDTSRLYTIWPGIDRLIALTPDRYRWLHVIGTDAQRERIYFWTAGSREGRINIYYRSLGGSIELWAANVLSPVTTGFEPMVITTPDLEWFFYGQETPNNTYTQWATNTRTGQRINVSHIIQPAVADARGGHFFSSDKQWLYITAWYTPPDSTDTTLDIFRISLTNQTAQNLTTDIAAQATLNTYTRAPDWLLFHTDSRPHQMRLDGSEKRLVLPEDEYARFPSDNIPSVSRYFPAIGVVLVEYEEHTWAIHLDSGHVLWDEKITWMGLWYSTPSPDWMLILKGDGTLAMLSIMDAHEIPLPAAWSPKDHRVLTILEDMQSLLYIESNDGFQTVDINTLNFQTGEQHMIRQEMSGISWDTISPDRQWLLGIKRDYRLQTFYRLNLSDGRLDRLASHTESGMLVGWLRYSPYHLASVRLGFSGVILMIAPYIFRRLRKWQNSGVG